MSAADVRRELLGIAADAPPNPFTFPRTYVVRNGRADGRLDLDPPADQRDVLPTLAGVAVWGAPGMSVQALPGDRVIVVFRDARPNQPAVVGFEPLSTGAHPKITLDADAITLAHSSDALVPGTETGRVVRYGDIVRWLGTNPNAPIMAGTVGPTNNISKVSA